MVLLQRLFARAPTHSLVAAFVMIGAASVLVGVVWAVAGAVGDPLRVSPELWSAPPKKLPLAEAIGATAIFGSVGLVAARLIYRYTKQPQLVLVAFSIVGLVSYGVLAFVKAPETSTAVWLNVMHLVAAGPIVGGVLSGRTPFSRTA